MKKLLVLSLLLVACSGKHKNTDAITGELVVDFKDDVTDSYVAELGEKLSIKFAPDSQYTNVDKIYLGHYYGDDEADVIEKLRDNSSVEAADEEMIYSIPENGFKFEAASSKNDGIKNTPNDRPNDPRFHEQWNLLQIGIHNSWNGNAGNGIIVAVIDTGVSRVEDMNQTEFVEGWNFVGNTKDASDDHGHGTHVAGTIAQSTNNSLGVAGIAYKAKIMPIKVLSAEGYGSVAAIAEGIQFAANNGAKVINMSLGGGGSNAVMKRAVQYAHDKGVVVVCAAGNDGRSKVSYPAAYPGAIAVAATQQDQKTAFYSNWGKEITIAAPGGNTRENKTGGILQNTILAGKEDYYYFMGTSMASPHVAGVAALIMSYGVSDPDKVKEILVDTARTPKGVDKNSKDYIKRYGAGIVNADAAVAKAQSLVLRKTGLKVLGVCFILFLGIILLRRKKK